MKEQFINYFKGRNDVFSQQLEDGSYRKVEWQFNEQDVDAHLNGRATYGLYLITPVVNTCYHTVIDIDDTDRTVLQKVCDTLLNLGIGKKQFWIEFSGNKGYHVWFRYADAMAASKAQKLGRAIVKLSNIDPATEVFPKQSEVSADNFGSLIKLPFCVHQKSKKRSTLLDENFNSIEQWDEVLQTVEHITEQQLDEILNKCEEKTVVKQVASANFPHQCINKIIDEGVGDGKRDEIAFNLALYLKNVQQWPHDKVLKYLIEWDKRNKPHLDEIKIRTKVDSAFSGKYDSNGINHPFVKSFCTANCQCGNNSVKELKPISGNELLALKIANCSLWGNGLLDAKSKLIISGDPKVGKSFFVLQFGVLLAKGEEFLGYKIHRECKVLYVQAEISDYRLQKRYSMMNHQLNCVQNLDFLNLKSFNMCNKGDFAALEACLTAKQYDVVIFDPLLMVHDKEENSAKEMKGVFEQFDALIDKFGVSVIIVHHYGKSIEGDGMKRTRGTSALRGWYDSFISLEHARKEQAIRLDWEMRNAEKPQALLIKRNTNMCYEVLGQSTKGKLGVADVKTAFNSFGKEIVTQPELIEKLKVTKGASPTTVRDKLIEMDGKYLLAGKDGKKKTWKLIN